MARLAAVCGLLAGAGLVTRAVAGGPPDTPAAVPRTVARAAPDVGATLVSRLGASRTAGHWTGAGGRTVVAVTDAAAAAEVRRAGAEPRVVRHSLRELRAAAATLRSAPRVAGTAWALDYRANEVVVRGDRTVSGADWSRLTGLARGIGGFVRTERAGGAFATRLSGAEPILSAGGRCSAGFDVGDGRRDFLLTAGHCGSPGTAWFGTDGGPRLGTTVAGSFPGDDFSLVEYAQGRADGGAGLVAAGGGEGVRITGVGEATVGQRVFRGGSTTGLREGWVTALDATVNYPEGTVTGLIQTDVCAEPGDSGGPLFSEGIALGVTSGGTGDCVRGGVTFFQPVAEALTSLGVRLITAPRGGSGRQAAPPPSAVADGAASVPGAGGSSPLSRLTGGRTAGPGLLLVGCGLLVLAVARRLRSKRDRAAYRRTCAVTWR